MIAVVYEDLVIGTALYHLPTSPGESTFVSKKHGVEVLRVGVAFRVILEQVVIIHIVKHVSVYSRSSMRGGKTIFLYVLMSDVLISLVSLFNVDRASCLEEEQVEVLL